MNYGKNKWRHELKRRLRQITFILILCLVFGAVLVRVGTSILYPLEHEVLINKYAEKYDIDPLLVASIINVESSFREEALSSRNAKGLMQISDITAEWAYEYLEHTKNQDLFDPNINIEIGCWLLSRLLDDFGDDNLELVLAAYNAGSGNVKSWLGDSECSSNGLTLDYIPFKETKNYLTKVKKNVEIYRFLYGSKL